MSPGYPETEEGGVAVELRPEDVLSALVVDDELESRESLRDELRTKGYKADAAKSLAEARELLARGAYSLVICDNVFVKLDATRGSAFLRDEKELLENAVVVLLTGFPLRHIVDSDQLRESGVEIIEKRPGASERLSEIETTVAHTRLSEARKDIELLINAYIRSGLRGLDSRAEFLDINALVRVGQHLLDHLRRLPRQEMKHIVYRRQAYSPKELVEAVISGSEEGRLLLLDFLDDALEG